MQSIKSLRINLRQRRRALSTAQQRHATERLYQHLIRWPHFTNSQHLAFYLNHDGEVNLTPLLHWAWQAKKHCYLPVLHPLGNGQLCFMRYRPGDRLVYNNYGLPEPIFNPRLCISPWALQRVLLPLVGFDKRGSRLGMGAGYYDKTFAFTQTAWRRPVLIGVAHECQRVPHIAKQPWDIPLDIVITDKTVYPVTIAYD